MRDPSRIHPFCKEIATAWAKFPDQRFGQFITNAVFCYYTYMQGGNEQMSLFRMLEDDMILRAVKFYAERGTV